LPIYRRAPRTHERRLRGAVASAAAAASRGSGLPVVAVAEGGPAAMVENRRTGMLCRPDADHIAGTVLQLAASPLLRRHLGSCAVRSARERSWGRAMEQLAEGYRRALAVVQTGSGQAPARVA
jgi:glycosyltransferase involved in cell wall biosynthesis